VDYLSITDARMMQLMQRSSGCADGEIRTEKKFKKRGESADYAICLIQVFTFCGIYSSSLCCRCSEFFAHHILPAIRGNSI
jgi:hypothetical protein